MRNIISLSELKAPISIGEMLGLLSTLTLLTTVFFSHAAEVDDWQLQHKTANIKLYSREIEHSDFIQIKAVVMVYAPYQDLLAQFGDGSQCWQWVTRCRSAKIIKTLSQHERLSYTALDFPWPLADRDFVFYSLLTIEPDTKITTLTLSPAKENYKTTKYLRAESNISYRIQPITDTTNLLTIIVHTEFGGSIIPEVINPNLVKELHEDVQRLVELLQPPSRRQEQRN
jgi:hypothetical protein